MMDEETHKVYVRWLNSSIDNMHMGGHPPTLRWTIAELVNLSSRYTIIPHSDNLTGWKVVERTPEYDVSFYMSDRKSG